MNDLTFETARSPLGLVALCAALLVGCEGTAADEGEPSLPLAGRTFLSQEVTDGGAARDLVANTLLRLRFHENDRLTASAGSHWRPAAGSTGCGTTPNLLEPYHPVEYVTLSESSPAPDP